jgi:hypothetical protein
MAIGFSGFMARLDDRGCSFYMARFECVDFHTTLGFPTYRTALYGHKDVYPPILRDKIDIRIRIDPLVQITLQIPGICIVF